MRLAWFSPFPPVRTGVADCSAGLVAALRGRGHHIDPYPAASAHDFPWHHRQRPYDLIVYQFGNSSHHDYAWAYALRYPGLVVLHDTRLHHARAAFLLREHRADDYRAEFRWSHPDVPADAAELAIAGLDSRLLYEWGMARGLIESSRLVAVHGEATRRELLASTPHLRQGYGGQANSTTPNSQAGNSQADNSQTANSQGDLLARVVSIRLGHGQFVGAEERQQARPRVRARHAIPDDAIVFGVFGGLTPEKRIPQVLRALRALLPYVPSARLLLGGAPAAHYDIVADVAALGLEPHVTLTGYLDTDAELTAHLAACDITLNLRWPTARETSGPWLRALAAGVATVITDLVHLGDVPSLDPRTWTENRPSALGIGLWEEPICVAIDILDEDHSLRLAMRRLAADGELRAQLGRAAQAWWVREHSVDVMVDDYERVMRDAAARPDPAVTLAPHMRDDGTRTLHALLAPFGLESPI